MAQAGTPTGNYHGALTFSGEPEQALDRFTRIATATLGDYGHPVERQSILSQAQSRILASQYLIRLHLNPSIDTSLMCGAGRSGCHRLEIELCPVSPERDDKDISELILVVMLYRMIDIFTTETVEWLDRDTVLTPEQFLGAFSNLSPQRVRGRQEIIDAQRVPFLSVDDTEQRLAHRIDNFTGKTMPENKCGMVDLTGEEALSLAYRVTPHPDIIEMPTKADQAASDIQRLATWGLTGMVGFLCAPVALSMAAVNLVRGEDFRLNTNVLALTGLVVMLQSTGALASVASYLPL